MRYHVEEGHAPEQHWRSLEVWKRNFSDPASFSKRYEWYYRNNPCSVYSFLLSDGACDIGAAGLSERRFRYFGPTQSVGLCSDFSVDAKNRFLMPAMTLQSAVRERALSQFPFVYGFPNRHAIGVMTRVGYRLLGPLTRYCLMLDSSMYLGKTRIRPLARWLSPIADGVVAGWLHLSRALLHDKGTLREMTMEGEDIDRLWQRAEKAPLMAIRDSQFFWWRFLNNPIDRFRIFGYFGQGSDAGFGGYAVVREEQGDWQLVDFLALRDELLPVLLLRVAQQAIAEGAKSLATEFFGKPAVHRALRRTGFLRRPSLRRIIIAARDGRAAKSKLLDARNWYITSADED